MQGSHQPEERSKPGVPVQPDRDPRHQEAQGSPGKDSGDWSLPELAGPEQPGMELGGVDKSVNMKLAQDFSQY